MALGGMDGCCKTDVLQLGRAPIGSPFAIVLVGRVSRNARYAQKIEKTRHGVLLVGFERLEDLGQGLVHFWMMLLGWPDWRGLEGIGLVIWTYARVTLDL